ncbi:MAG: hypothetical protein RMM28_09820 [Thermoleophilia bacterium]|nr:hypothetical protein [Gaiellaceae bacterium]MDW8339422.1 hypothetical protein [Thermoleophilia bacterium]
MTNQLLAGAALAPHSAGAGAERSGAKTPTVPQLDFPLVAKTELWDTTATRGAPDAMRGSTWRIRGVLPSSWSNPAP